MVDLLLGIDIDEEERQLLYNKLGLNMIDFDKEFERIKKERTKELKRLKEDNRYKEYLRLTIDEDIKTVVELEEDEVFNYLIEQNFHSKSFNNEPCINFIFFKYQPKYWKYAKAANEIAKRHGFTDGKQMFEVWRKLRSVYHSLVDDKKTTDIIKESEVIEKEITELEDKIENIDIEYANEVKKRLVNILKRLPEQKYDLFNQAEVENIIRIKQELVAQKEQIKPLNDRLTIIMDNINSIEKMISSAEIGNLHLDESQVQEFFNCTNPSVPIQRLIPQKDWEDVEKAFSEFGIQLKDREDYTVVEKHINKKEKERLLKKYNVKEGEIFIDEELM